MITFDFDYYRPDFLEEAVQTFKRLSEQGKTVKYYAGGTELISLARLNQARFDAVVDLKGVPECNVLEFQGDKLVIGAAVTLTKIADSGFFPCLGAVARQSADHTARDKITLGGNICGIIPYKEAILPLLLADSEVVVAGESGQKTATLTASFDKELRLGSGEFLVQVKVDKHYLAGLYTHVKRTRQERMGYPLVSVTAMELNQRFRFAMSGVCPFPFRSMQVEADLNNRAISLEERINQVMQHLPAPIFSDLLASAEYREFVARNVLGEAIENLGGIK